MKKIAAIICVMMIASVVVAQNLYKQVQYSQIVPPSKIGTYMSGETNAAVSVTVASVSNATGVAVNSYPGTGALMLHINCGNGGAGVITWTSYSTTNIGSSSSYTNGTFVASTNQDTYTLAWTNAATNVVFPFVCNRELGWIQERFLATGVTNGSVSAELVTIPR